MGAARGVHHITDKFLAMVLMQLVWFALAKSGSGHGARRKPLGRVADQPNHSPPSQRFFASNGKNTNAKEAVAVASKKLHSLCPGAAS